MARTKRTRKRTASMALDEPASPIMRDYLTAEMVGIVATYLPGYRHVHSLASALEDATRHVGYYAAAVAQIHRTCPRFSEMVLENAYDWLPGKNSSCDGSGYDDPPDRREELYEMAGDTVRGWIRANPTGWRDRVAVSSLADAPRYAGSSPILRKVTVSQRVAHSICLYGMVGPDECRHRVHGERCRKYMTEKGSEAIAPEYESCLLAVNGKSVHTCTSDVFWDSSSGIWDEKDLNARYGGDFLPGKGYLPCDLVFMSRGDLFFNEVLLVVRLGLGEVLGEMCRKKLIAPDSTVYTTAYPLLWLTYFDSPNASCFEALLAQEDVDCNVIHDHELGMGGANFLIVASDEARFPIGKDAYRALVNHPGTDVNAQVKESTKVNMYQTFLVGDTALHVAVSNLNDLRNKGDRIVSMVLMLIEAGADPMIKGSKKRGTVIDYFRRIRSGGNSFLDDRYGRRREPRTFKRHFDAIEAMLTAKTASAVVESVSALPPPPQPLDIAHLTGSPYVFCDIGKSNKGVSLGVVRLVAAQDGSIEVHSVESSGQSRPIGRVCAATKHGTIIRNIVQLPVEVTAALTTIGRFQSNVRVDYRPKKGVARDDALEALARLLDDAPISTVKCQEKVQSKKKRKRNRRGS